MEQSETRQLISEIEKLRKEIAGQNSFKQKFFMAIVHGLGYAVGFTLIATIGLTIFSRVVNEVEDVPIIKDIIDEVEAN